jgi:hypothetical protein
MAEKMSLQIEYDKEAGRMSCKCHASVNDLVEMTGYLLRYQVVLNAKEVAESQGAVITEEQGKQILHQVAKQFSEKIARIIEFGEEEELSR